MSENSSFGSSEMTTAEIAPTVSVWMEIQASDAVLETWFEGPICEVGQAVELICVERSAGGMRLNLRTKGGRA